MAELAEASTGNTGIRTRLYRSGDLVEEGFALAAVSDYLTEPDVVVWVDLRNPDQGSLEALGEELGMHELAVEDAGERRERPKLDTYPTHAFLNAYAVRFTGADELDSSEVSAFLLPNALVTVRKNDWFDISQVVARWDSAAPAERTKVSYFLYALLDDLVDGHFEAVEDLDEAIESLEDLLFQPANTTMEVQKRSFALRKSLVTLRRLVLPMREVINTLMRRDLGLVDADMAPYYQDIYDHVLRATEWTESLRDLVTTVLETNITIQGNRLNTISKKVTGWAAIIAVPTFVTGFFGMNVPYPGFAKQVGLEAAISIMAITSAALFMLFKVLDWI